MTGFNPIQSFGKSAQILNLVAKRQKLLTTNVANVDTPGYVRQDINFASYLGNANGPMETKLSLEMGASAVVSQETGEGVNVPDELVCMQENSLLYTMATRRMSNIITMMKSALNVGR